MVKKHWIYALGIMFLLVNCALYLTKDFYLLNLAPLALLVLFTAFFALDYLFLFIVVATPLSLNQEELSGGIGLYLPTEPMLLILMLVFLFKQTKNSKHRDSRITNHPVSIAIYFHLTWIFITSLTSEIPLVSFKFLLSRAWFIVPCYFFGIWFFRKNFKYITTFLWAYLIPLTVVLFITLLKHSTYGFGEEAGHWVMSPFFKDHTSYGAIIALFFPVVFLLLFNKHQTFSTKALLFLIAAIFCIALFYSYTRAAWLSVVGAGLVYLLFLFKIKFSYLAIFGLFIGSFVAVNFTEINYMLKKNNAEHTTDNFNERIESMSNVTTDASNLERLNRWNSAIKLFKERPLMGWGPGTYAMVYAPHQSSVDLTIISTNFGTGGNAHSEYLGPLAEQGPLGIVSIIWLLIAVFYTASRLYIRLTDPIQKAWVMMSILALVTYFTHGILNNYLDTDKASVPVWVFIAIIVTLDIYTRENDSLEESTADNGSIV